MVRKLFNNNCGAYMPGFFCMDLNMKFGDGFDLNILNDKDKATLFHEYIHYLQEISTTSGVCNFNHVVNMIQLYINRVYENENNIVEIPIDIQKSGVENAYQKYELMALHLGDEQHKKIHHVDKVCVEKESIYNEMFDIKDDSEEAVSIVNIYYDNKENPYMFGRTCISESMAYLIERSIYSSEERKNEFPYNSCELLCQTLYPEISQSYSIIVAICDMSLMDRDSGRFFYEVIMHMKKEKYIPKSVDDVYKYLEGKMENLLSYYEEEYSLVKERIDFLYPKNIEVLSSVNKWMKDKLDLAYHYRVKKQGFIANIMEVDSKEKACIYFACLMNTFSLPLIKDNNDFVYNIEEDINLFLLLGVVALSDILTKTNGFVCSIYPICKANKEKNLCEACTKYPWKLVDNDELCPLAIYWYRFKLSGKSLKYKF